MTRQHEAVAERSADPQLARTLSRLMVAILATYVVVAFVALHFNEWILLGTMGGASLLLALPWWWLRRGELRPAGVAIVMSVILSLTVIATVGQGIHDLAIVAFPIVFVFAGLTLSRTVLKLSVGLTLVATIWLAFGESGGWFDAKPLFPDPSNLFYWIGVTVTLLVAAVAVELMSSNLLKTLALAHQEIAQRKDTEAALRESEERFRTFFNDAVIGLYRTTPQGRFILANPALLRMLGHASLEDLAEHHIETKNLASTHSRAGIHERLERDGRVVALETTWTRRDGSPLIVRENCHAVRDAKGELAYHEGSVEDITDLKRAEGALRAEAARLGHILEATSSGVWDWNIPSGAVVFSPSYSRMLGYTPEEFALAYKEWELLVHPDDFARVDQGHSDHFHKQKVFSIEYRMREKSGGWHWIHSRGILIERDSEGNPLRMVGTHTDIQERKLAEYALRESETRYRALTQSASDAIVTINGDATIAGWNAASEKMFGYAEADVLGQPVIRIIPSRFRDRHGAGLRRLQEGGEGRVLGTSLELAGLRRDGSEFPLELSLSRWSAGERNYYTGIIRDITERTRAVAEKDALEHQLQQTQKMESVGRLAGGVAHDFNNMLAVILGHADLMMRRLGPGQPLHAELSEIHDAAMRSADLTRQLLIFARKQVVMPKVLDLNATVAQALKMLQRLIGENIRLDWRPGANLWPVRMDVSQVDQLLANLSINARDAIAGVGTLTVTTANRVVDAPMWDAHMQAAPGDYVQLTVRDDGCGMASDVRARVFEPFFTTKDVGEGTGLGLATVYGIVQQGNGFIEMASAPGEGTTFEIYFPRYLGDLAASDSADPAAPIPRGTETILVVEDEPAVRRVTARALEAQGYDVLEADGPHAAIRVAQERGEAITLLLTDVVMPEMSGHELADALAADHPHLKHLFMSGYPERGGKRREPPEDAAHFLVKPFTLAELATKVRAVMDCE